MNVENTRIQIILKNLKIFTSKLLHPMETLLNIDKQLFLFVNQTLSNDFFDLIMPFITDKKNWIFIYIIGFIYLLFKHKWKGLIIISTLLIGVLIADQVSANLIKDWVGRLRPCHDLDNVNLLVNCGSGKSFPSAHATNNFFAAFTLSHFFKKQTHIFYIIAFLVAISRVFVGVHYPLDITAGALLGILIGFLLTTILRLFYKK